MWRYLQMHEKLIRSLLEADAPDTDWIGVLALHNEVLDRMQRERLIHLIVTMFFALYMLLCIAFSFVSPTWPVAVMDVLFIGITAAYIQHYFRLENGVQRWYFLGHQLAAKAGRLSADYQGSLPKLLINEKKG